MKVDRNAKGLGRRKGDSVRDEGTGMSPTWFSGSGVRRYIKEEENGRFCESSG